MFYKFFFLFILMCLNSCIENPIKQTNKIISNKEFFSNKGFTLVYSDDLFTEKYLNKKLKERELLIFQKNLKKDTKVKITNLVNNRSILVRVGQPANYPKFYNSVISKRIAKEIDLNLDEPYIKISEFGTNSAFVAKRAKTFDEEKNVATKVPVDEIKVSELTKTTKTMTEINKKRFNYIIKIADLYFIDSANALVTRIKDETVIKNVFINNLSKSKYRVYLGPFDNINLLQKAFNDIEVLEFENIEIIYND